MTNKLFGHSFKKYAGNGMETVNETDANYF